MTTIFKKLTLLSTVLLISQGYAAKSVTAIDAKAVAPVANAEAITISNHADNETIRFPMPILSGTLSDTGTREIIVLNKTTGKKMQGLAENGEFKVLTMLKPGKNKLEIKSNKNTKKMVINYKPITNPHYVRLVYFTDNSGEDQLFHTMESENPKDYKKRFATMGRTLQTFTAEKLGDIGLPKMTFRLDEDAKGQPMVYLVKGDLSRQDYQKMGRGQLYETIKAELNEKMPDKYVKNIVMPAFSYFNRQEKRNMAYTALGGGNQALFGGGNIFAWPTKIEDLQKAFMNAAILDTDLFSNDSVGRNVLWGSMSTCYGAIMHELGHTFNLYHITDGQGIMSRGFDRFSRAFVVNEAPSMQNPHYTSFNKKNVAYFNPSNAQLLYFDRWFAPDSPVSLDVKEATKHTFDADKKEFTITSPNGIGAILVGTVDVITTNVKIDHSKGAPKSVTVKVDDFKKVLYKERAIFQISDAAGNVSYIRMDKYFPATTK